jgi:hypothetical protein
MSLLADLKRKSGQWAAAWRPVFGIIREPGAAPTPLALEPSRAQEVPAAEEDGLVPAARIRTDRANRDEELDEVVRLAVAGDWRSVADRCGAIAAGWERWEAVLSALADFSTEDDAWLSAWLEARPDDAVALTVRGRSLVALAWKIRTSRDAEHVSRDQWEAFHRLLRQAPAICDRAAQSRPADPTPLVTMLGAATGLGWSHGDFRALWGRVCERDPLHVAAHRAAMFYWLPRWHGSTDLVTAFVDDVLGSARPGSLLTMLRLELLYLERHRNGADGARAVFNREAVNTALDEALADLAVAAAHRPQLPIMRHWLAYHLTEVERYAEAVEQFRLIGGFCGASPWKYAASPLKSFTRHRAKAIAGREGAGA